MVMMFTMSRQDLIFRSAVIVLLVAILGTGLGLLVRNDTTAGPVEISIPTREPAKPLVVQVSGAVSREGLYTLETSGRVADAVHAAGGLTADADPSAINLAARLIDGQQVHVPTKLTPAALASVSSPTQGGPLNINLANKPDLEALPGIGPSLAQAILDYRDKNGAFLRVEDLLNVPGIGEGILARIRGLITV